MPARRHARATLPAAIALTAKAASCSLSHRSTGWNTAQLIATRGRQRASAAATASGCVTSASARASCTTVAGSRPASAAVATSASPTWP